MPSSCSAGSRCRSPPTAACRSNTPRALIFCGKHPNSSLRCAASVSTANSILPTGILKFYLTVAIPTWNRSTATSPICGRFCAAKTGFCCAAIRRSSQPSTIRCRLRARCCLATSKRPGRQIDAWRIDGGHIPSIDFRQPRDDRVAALHRARLERRTKYLWRQRGERRLGDRREAQMPGLRLHASPISAVGPEEAELRHIVGQPGVEAREWAIARELGRHQARTVVGCNGRAIDDVQIRTPMMTARARKSGPDENGVDESAFVQAAVSQGAAAAVEELTLAQVLRIPDRNLAIKVAEARNDCKLDPDRARSRAHCERLGRRLAVQNTAELGDFPHVRAGAASQLEAIEHFLTD